jgi:hypothetical protein
MESETLPGKKLRKRQTGLQPSTSLDNILAVHHLGLEESDDEDVVFHSLSDSKVWPHACSNKCCPSWWW